MGTKVSQSRLMFVSFQYRDGAFVAFVPVEAIARDHVLSHTVSAASRSYAKSIRRLKVLIRNMQASRKGRRPIRALQAWRVGDEIFSLRRALADLSLELDGVYDHLTKHLGVSRTWLKRAVTFRRHLPDPRCIPSALAWARCKDRPRRVAEQLRAPMQGE